MLSGAEISSDAQVLLPSSLVVRRFQFLAVVALRLSGPEGHHLPLALSTTLQFPSSRLKGESLLLLLSPGRGLSPYLSFSY